MKSQTWQYYMHDGPAAFRFELAGDLDNEGARDLEQAWRTASAVIGDRTLVVDMTFVASVGQYGRSLLARWYAEGAELVARSKVSRDLAETIVGVPLPESTSCRTQVAERTWLPFHISFGATKHANSPARAEHVRGVSEAPANETSAFAWMPAKRKIGAPRPL